MKNVEQQVLERMPSSEEERAVLGRVWSQVERTGGRIPDDVLRDVQPRRSLLAEAGPRRQQRARVVLMGAAAATLALAVGTAILWPRGDTAFYRVVDGTVQTGDTIQTNGGGAQLALVDGSRVEMRSQSELFVERADDGLRIRLSKGGIIVNAAKQRTGHLYVQTKDVTVSVVGTVFLVNATEDGSRVAVIEGEVHVQQGATERKLLPGEQVSTNPSMTSSPVKDTIAWSRNAAALVTQLQQAAVAPPALAPQNPAQSREAFEVVSIRRTADPAAAAARGGGGGGGLARRSRNPRGDNPCSVIVEPEIDPRRFDARNATVVQLIAWAMGVRCVGDDGSYFLFGAPDWTKTEGFDVQALRPEDASDYMSSTLSGTRAVQTPGPRLRRMLHTMLEERFKLTMHREPREMSVYVLSVAKGGPKYTASRPAGSGPQVVNGVPAAGGRGEGSRIDPEFSVWKEEDNLCCDSAGPASIDGRKKPLSYVTGTLEYFLGRPILDRTGLTGEFNFFFNFAPIERPGMPPVRATEGPLSTRPIFEVLEQVGLELVPGQEKVDVWVIDAVERPTEN